MSAFTRSVRGFDAATAVSVLPVSSSPSSAMNKIDPIVVYANSNTSTPVEKHNDEVSHF